MSAWYEWTFDCLWISAWAWVPMVWCAYCVGRRQVSIRSILVLTGVEAVAIYWFVTIYNRAAFS